MKRIITAAIAIVIALSTLICSAYADYNEMPQTDWSDSVALKAADDYNYAGFCGRLSIPNVGINVAMYNTLSQGVCDREDSACMFNLSSYYGYIIADHSNQDFSVLPYVTVGTIGGIVQSSGDVVFIRCCEVFQGHNTGSRITDANYNCVFGLYDYLMYTCLDGWTNVQVTQWSVVGSWSSMYGTMEELANLGTALGVSTDALLSVMY